MEEKKKFGFRKPNFENARKEADERSEKIKKFSESMERAQRVSSKTWHRRFDI